MSEAKAIQERIAKSICTLICVWDPSPLCAKYPVSTASNIIFLFFQRTEFVS
jgi:hypothetical protein